MSPTLSSGTYLCARRRWLCNTFHTSASSYFNREKLNERKQKLGDQHPSSPPKGIKRKTTGPSVVEKSKIRQHLDHIESTKDNLSLQDVERYKPGKALDFRQPTYDQKYKEIQNALIQSFTKPQLRRFLKLYGVSLPSGCKGKNNFAEILLKQWGLEPLDKVKEERTDWQEKSERLYPMSPAYAFLFMGKDGTDLLNLAKRYDVHLSFTSEPLSLRILGLRGAIKQLDGYLKNFEDDTASETIRMPYDLAISPQIAKSISRLSGAHVEAFDDGKLFITYRKSDPASATCVTRLAVQAASRQLDVYESSLHFIGESPGIVTKLVEEPEPSQAFYPFFSAQVSLSGSLSSSAFRLRRVGQWLRAGAKFSMDGENIGGISLDRESACRIKTQLLQELSNLHPSDAKLVVTAAPGHILFLAPEGQTTFRPPIPGNVTQGVIVKWAEENRSRVFFNPSIPKNLMTCWPHKQNRFQRIVYKALPQNLGTIRGNSLRKTFVLEILPTLGNPDCETSRPSPIIRCERSIEANADILLPSQATDIRISVSRVESIASWNMPKELLSFTKELDSLTNSVPPSTLTLDGVHYILSSTSQIRQEHKCIPRSPKELSYDFVVETTIDPEDGLQLMVCKVPCVNTASDWNEFFEHCDHISMAESKVLEHPLAVMKPWFEDSNTSANKGTQNENRGG